MTLAFTGALSLLLLGPLGNFIGSGLTGALTLLYMKAGMIAGFILGGLYALIVITGLDHSFYLIEAGLC